MRIVRSIAEAGYERNSVVTVGTFDGVHLAHAEIVREVLHRAKRCEGRSVIVTFNPHPKEVTGKKDSPPLLTTLEERVEIFEALGVDVLFVVNFTFAFSRLTSKQFYRQYLVEGTGLGEVVVGYDHMFGRDREAGIEELVRMGKEFDFSVFAVHPFTVDEEPVSSSLIRDALRAGNVERARKFLGRPYRFSGKVIKGDGRGKSLGYATANLDTSSERKMLPRNGVYLVGTTRGTDQHFGMMNIGTRPTVKSNAGEIVEVHLFDFNEDIYGELLAITLLKRLRDEQRFPSLEDLISQLHRDRELSLRMVHELAKQK